MMYGWTGKYLRVNLTDESWTVEPTPALWARDYIGGRGLGARCLYEWMDPTVDPLGPDNILIFATGPMTGTNAPTATRYMVVTKGPLTGAITTSNSGGYFGPQLKYAGYDMLVLEGRASKPMYLFINDDQIEFRDASRMWGKTVSQTEDGVREELGLPDARVACIGPAGENKVRFAAIMNDKHRAAGRSGVGAVMGSKNLKAIAVRGTGGVNVAKPAVFLKTLWKFRKTLAEGVEGLARYGTAATVDMTNAMGGLPTRNFQQGQFERSGEINGSTLRERHLLRNKACFACTIACGRVTKIGPQAEQFMVNTHPRNWRPAGEGVEYETTWALGADTGVGDLDAVLMASYLCNDLGMDPISMGATLAAAMEMYEKGTINDEIAGMPLPFGSGEALVRLTEATAYREGFGHELAEGSKRMTEKYDCPELHMGSKGQEFPAYEPRGFQGMGIAYATCNRGGCHIRAWTPAIEAFGKADPHTPDGKAEWVVEQQNLTTAHDSTGLCLFVGADNLTTSLLPSLNAATGIDYTAQDIVEAGERIWNLERLFNNAAGLTAADDSLPRRLLEETLDEGPSAGVVVHLDEMLSKYYESRDWSPAGVPSPQKLAALRIDAQSLSTGKG